MKTTIQLFKQKWLFLPFLLAALIFGVQTAMAAGAPYAAITLNYSFSDDFGPHTGTIILQTLNDNDDQAGYNFVDEEYTSYSGGAFYVISEKGKLLFFGNNEGQGGIIRLRGVNSKMPNASVTKYNRLGLPVVAKGVYAVYDEANDIYIKIRVTRIVYKKQPATPTVVPKADTTFPVSEPTYNSSLTVENSRYIGSCPTTLWFSGTISTNQVGKVQYRFIRSDGASAPVQEIYFDKPGSKQVKDGWTLGSSTQSGNSPNWEAIQIIYPWFSISNKAEFTVNCTNNASTSNFVTIPTAAVAATAAPTNLQYTVDANAQAANLSWARSASILNYQLQVDCQGCGAAAGWSNFIDSPIDPSAAWYMSATPGRTEVRVTASEKINYRFRVRSQNSDGAYSAWSDYINYTGPTKITENAGPIGLQFSLDYPAQAANLSWDKASGVKQYRLQIDCNSCGEDNGWYNYMDIPVNADAAWYNSKTPGRMEVRIAMPENKEYRFRVWSQNLNDTDGVWSNYVNFNYSKPTISYGVSSFGIYTNSVKLDDNGLSLAWTPKAGAIQYTVNIYCPDHSCQERIITTAQTNLTDSSFKKTNDYRIFVRPENSNFEFFDKSGIFAI